MNSNLFIQPSEFDNTDAKWNDMIDFEKVFKLNRIGSTCDAFITRYHHRRVFIKHLKPQFRHNPLYLTALEKEFEIGITLKHPSLPEYIEFSRDLIIMNYVDGKTLAEIICEAKDNLSPNNSDVNWLRQKRNIKRVLTDLTEVIGYLHRHNVVHCDIKPDNIILTEESHNVILLDLDKAYTDWLDETSGSPNLYGLNNLKKGSTDIDFHGLGYIIDQLGCAGFPISHLKKFRYKCFMENIDHETLLSILSHNNAPKPTTSITILAICIIAYFFVSNKYLHRDKSNHVSNDKISDTSSTHPQISQTDNLIIPLITPDDTTNYITPPAESGHSIVTEAIQTDKIDLHEEKEKDEFNAKMATIFLTLYTPLDKLKQTIENPFINSKELQDSIIAFTELETATLSKAYQIAIDASSTTDHFEALKMVWNSTPYLDYTKKANVIQHQAGEKFKKLVVDEKQAINFIDTSIQESVDTIRQRTFIEETPPHFAE